MLGLGALGCATLPPCPAKGGPAWLELSSAHFVVRTDLEKPAGEEVVRRLEETRGALLAMAWPGAPDPPGRVSVVAFRSQRELGAFVPDAVVGEWRRSPPFQQTILMTGAATKAEIETIVHEMAHELSRRFIPVQPPWFTEGLAAYFETLSFDRSTQVATVGAATDKRLSWLRGLDRPRPSWLVSATREPPGGAELARFEAGSWLLFHDLMDNRPDALVAYQAAIGRLTPPERAWTQAFPDLSFEQLDKELNAYLRDGRLKGGQRQLSIAVGPIAWRKLEDAEVHATLAFLFATSGLPDAERAFREQLAEARTSDPDQLEALAVGFYARGAAKTDQAEWARRARAAHPASGLAAAMFVDAFGLTDQGSRRALVEALAAAPNDLEIISRLARLAGTQDQWEQALALSTRALRLGGSYDDRLLTVHARALANVGNCTDAGFFVAALVHRLLPSEQSALARGVETLCPH